MSYLEWLKADIDTRIKKMEILVSMNNPINQPRIDELKGEIYEREQTMDALTGEFA